MGPIAARTRSEAHGVRCGIRAELLARHVTRDMIRGARCVVTQRSARRRRHAARASRASRARSEQREELEGALGAQPLAGLVQVVAVRQEMLRREAVEELEQAPGEALAEKAVRLLERQAPTVA